MNSRSMIADHFVVHSRKQSTNSKSSKSSPNCPAWTMLMVHCPSEEREAGTTGNQPNKCTASERAFNVIFVRDGNRYHAGLVLLGSGREG
eukprot:m.1633224 g.1633224  ORF g.1633224 m.1633224 type:complete len:90 (+) comp25406_c0_seq26:10752-11021(+)